MVKKISLRLKQSSNRKKSVRRRRSSKRKKSVRRRRSSKRKKSVRRRRSSKRKKSVRRRRSSKRKKSVRRRRSSNRKKSVRRRQRGGADTGTTNSVQMRLDQAKALKAKTRQPTTVASVWNVEASERIDKILVANLMHAQAPAQASWPNPSIGWVTVPELWSLLVPTTVVHFTLQDHGINIVLSAVSSAPVSQQDRESLMTASGPHDQLIYMGPQAINADHVTISKLINEFRRKDLPSTIPSGHLEVGGPTPVTGNDGGYIAYGKHTEKEYRFGTRETLKYRLLLNMQSQSPTFCKSLANLHKRIVTKFFKTACPDLIKDSLPININVYNGARGSSTQPLASFVALTGHDWISSKYKIHIVCNYKYHTFCYKKFIEYLSTGPDKDGNPQSFNTDTQYVPDVGFAKHKIFWIRTTNQFYNKNDTGEQNTLPIHDSLVQSKPKKKSPSTKLWEPANGWMNNSLSEAARGNIVIYPNVECDGNVEIFKKYLYNFMKWWKTNVEDFVGPQIGRDKHYIKFNEKLSDTIYIAYGSDSAARLTYLESIDIPAGLGEFEGLDRHGVKLDVFGHQVKNFKQSPDLKKIFSTESGSYCHTDTSNTVKTQLNNCLSEKYAINNPNDYCDINYKATRDNLRHGNSWILDNNGPRGFKDNDVVQDSLCSEIITPLPEAAADGEAAEGQAVAAALASAMKSGDRVDDGEYEEAVVENEGAAEMLPQKPPDLRKTRLGGPILEDVNT